MGQRPEGHRSQFGRSADDFSRLLEHERSESEIALKPRAQQLFPMHPQFRLLRFLRAVGLALLCGHAAAAATQPNLVVIMTDDQGYWDLGSTGNPYIETPNLDALARSGVRFSRYYVAPVCSPTRAGMMTGRYAAARLRRISRSLPGAH